MINAAEKKVKAAAFAGKDPLADLPPERVREMARILAEPESSFRFAPRPRPCRHCYAGRQS